MRKQLYLALIQRLKEIKNENGEQTFKHLDLWNEQVVFLEQEEPFDLPAVFIEFLPIQWQTANDGAQTSVAQFRLHVITSSKGSARDGSAYQAESLELFDLIESVNHALFKLSGDGFRATQRIRSDTNHNHEELIESMETYQVSAVDISGRQQWQKAMPDIKIEATVDHSSSR